MPKLELASVFHNRKRRLSRHSSRRLGSRFGFRISDLLSLLLTLAVCACLTGCSFLKPAKPTARYFVLTPLPATGPGLAAPNTLAVGLGQVKLPAYLFETSLAVRKGTNEIEYLPSSLWAERLDTGFQRVLAANLAIVLPTEQVRLSAWQRDAVAAEVYVSYRAVRRGRQRPRSARRAVAHPLAGRREDPQGRREPSRRARARRRTPSTSGAVATLSELVADFSRAVGAGAQRDDARALPAPPTQ